MKGFKAAVIFIGFIAFVHCYTDEQMAMYREMSDACVLSSGVDEGLVAKSEADAVYGNDPKFQEYVFCMLKTPGFMNDAGDYQVDTIRDIVTQEMDAQLAAVVVDKCTKFTGDKLTKANALAQCMHLAAYH